jgi:4-alpha-glucanotransferase
MTRTQRASGVLLHITSLSSDFGIGDLGPWSYRFVDFLSKANQHIWSILPLTPTSTQYGNSPYHSTSAFAGNTLLLSPELLFEDGLLTKEDVEALKQPFGRVDYKTVTLTKEKMIKKAYLNFTQNKTSANKISECDFEKFCIENSCWLNDFALFSALEDATEKPWYLWSSQLRDRDAKVLAQEEAELKNNVVQEKFAQYLFSRQWKALKEYCLTKEVAVFGDLPFYMSYDSADVWVHPELFKLDNQKRPRYVGGVPPDYFCASGQRWGNPVYNWRELKETHYQWWISRIRHNLKLCDVLRFDHFRGFTSYWQIPASCKTAKKGRWLRSPSRSFFEALKRSFPNLPFIAEDLGLITVNVRENLRLLGIPGMKVLVFAFNESSDNPNLPGNYTENAVVYTGTHDTNTVKGWFTDEVACEEKECFFKYIGGKIPENQVSFEFIKLALTSRANLTIIPMQDLLSLGSEARMNNPAETAHNWEWRLKSEQLKDKNFEEFRTLTEASGRRVGRTRLTPERSFLSD